MLLFCLKLTHVSPHIAFGMKLKLLHPAGDAAVSVLIWPLHVPHIICCQFPSLSAVQAYWTHPHSGSRIYLALNSVPLRMLSFCLECCFPSFSQLASPCSVELICLASEKPPLTLQTSCLFFVLWFLTCWSYCSLIDCSNLLFSSGSHSLYC